MNTNKIIAIWALCMALTGTLFAQEPVPTNRYAMKLEKKADGTYALQREERYAKILNLSEIPDLYTPYVHQNNRLSGKLYNKVQTEEVVYKKYDTYELRIAIDKSMAEGDSPVMFFVHGGGWARGTFDASRSLSEEDRRTAIQKSAVRPSYSNLMNKSEKYLHQTMGYNLYVTDIQQSGEEWIIQAAMVRNGEHYRNTVYFTTDEDPGLEIGSRYLMYGEYVGSYIVQADDAAEQFPGFDLLFVIK